MKEQMGLAKKLVKQTEEVKEKLQEGGAGALDAHFELQNIQQEAYGSKELRKEAEQEKESHELVTLAEKFKTEGFEFKDATGTTINLDAKTIEKLMQKLLISDRDLEKNLIALPLTDFSFYMDELSPSVVNNLHSMGDQEIRNKMERSYESELNHAEYILEGQTNYDVRDVQRSLRRIGKFKEIIGMRDTRLSSTQNKFPVEDLIMKLNAKSGPVQ